MPLRLNHFAGAAGLFIWTWTLGLAASPARAAEPALWPANPVLDAYLRDARTANLGLRQRRVSADEAEARVTEARAAFFPTVGVEARASERYGAVLDLGSLVNPAYAALNQLVGQARFPTDIQVALPLRRETKLVVTQPLFAPAIAAVYALRRDQVDTEEARWRAFARQVRAEVETTYFQYGRASRLVGLLDDTRTLVEETLRVSLLLAQTGKVTDDAVYRARADLSELAIRRDEAADGAEAARRYLNFLAQRPIDAAVPPPPPIDVPAALPVDERAAADHGAARDELAALDGGRRAAADGARFARDAYWPTLGAAAEYGFQGDRYDFSLDKDYLIVSLVLRWNLWNGLGDRARTRAAELTATRLDLAAQELRGQITLEIRQAWRAAATARATIGRLQDRVDGNRASYAIVSRKYAAGAAPPVELIDARTALTRAEVDQVVARYDFAIKLVELERVAALDSEIVP